MWDVDKCIFYGKILECLQRLIEAEDQEKIFLTLTNQYIKISTLTTRSDINHFRDLFDFVGFHIYKKHTRKPGTQTLLRRSSLWWCFSSSFLPSVCFMQVHYNNFRDMQFQIMALSHKKNLKLFRFLKRIKMANVFLFLFYFRIE